MTNNPIPNVPRELLERVSDLWPADMSDDGSGRIGWLPHVPKTVAQLRALLSAPSPAGVYSADPLACTGCASGCFRCASPAGVDADHVEDVRRMVPYDPTPAMVTAAEDAYMPFGDMELAVRMAILAAPKESGE